MGANWIETHFPGDSTPDQIRAEFSRLREEAAYDDGHQYSGSWNMLQGVSFERRVFPSVGAAREWLLENAEKWEDAVAARYKRQRRVIDQCATYGGAECNYGSVGLPVGSKLFMVTRKLTGEQVSEVFVPADLLSPTVGAAVVKAAEGLVATDRAQRQAERDLHLIVQAIERLEPVKATDIKAAQNRVAKAAAAAEKAKARVLQLNERYESRIERSHLEPEETCWLLGGWAAS